MSVLFSETRRRDPARSPHQEVLVPTRTNNIHAGRGRAGAQGTVGKVNSGYGSQRTKTTEYSRKNKGGKLYHVNEL